MNGLLPSGRPGTCSFSGKAPKASARRISYCCGWPGNPAQPGTAAKRVSTLDVAVKEGGELRLRERPDARRLDVAVLEQHQRRDTADAELRRHALVLIHVDLGDLQPALVFPGDLVEDRRDGLAGAAPFGPVVHQHRGVRLQDLGVESVVGDMAYVWTAHGSFQGGVTRSLHYGGAAGESQDTW